MPKAARFTAAYGWLLSSKLKIINFFTRPDYELATLYDEIPRLVYRSDARAARAAEVLIPQPDLG